MSIGTPAFARGRPGHRRGHPFSRRPGVAPTTLRTCGLGVPDIDITSPWPGPELARLLRPCGVPVPLLGAGISAGAGLPLGADLAAWIAVHPLANGVDFSPLPADGARRNPLQVAQLLLDERPDAAESLDRAVRDLIAERSAAASLTDELLAIARTPGRLVLSLNYDPLIQRAAEAQGIAVVTVTRREIARLIGARLPRRDDPLHVVHLHGTVTRPDPLVLAAESYGNAMADGNVVALMSAVISHRAFCLIGTSFEEPYLKDIFQRFRHSPPRHVVVCPEDVAGLIDANDARAPLNRLHGLAPCSYARDRHDVLGPFCSELVRCEGVETSSHQPAEVITDPLYTPRRLLRVDEHDDPQVALMLGTTELIDEATLATEHRAVVVGLPGSGKSELLKHLASNPDSDSLPALVRMRDVSAVTGSAESLLREWLISADAAYATVDPDEAIDGDVRVHLMLDALDEHQPTTRAAAVDAIARVADAYPAIRITLTTRPTVAITELDWPTYELQADPRWREDFLRTAGSSTEELFARVAQARPGIDPLLSIPFFVRRLVELGDAQLQDALTRADVIAITKALLCQQVDADPGLARDAGAVVTWLTRVALWMQLTGSRRTSLAELAPLTAELGLGEPTLLTERLAGRSLFEETADGWSFGHRVFADCLVADALTDADPAAWLDIVAPVAHGRSALREDWEAPIGYLCRAYLPWREAIDGRDSAAAARSVPADADRDGRHRAASVLWARAHRLQVWLDDSMGRGHDDAAVIGAMIAAGGLDDIARQIELALQSESRYDRANALDALMHAQPERGAELIAAVLVNEPDSTVRRSAASWARRLELYELRDLVLARALDPADDAEAGDMASVALRLTPARNRAEVGRRMLAAGNTDVRDYTIVDGLEPVEQIRWMLDVARAKPEEATYGSYSQLTQSIGQLEDTTPDEERDVGEILALTHATDLETLAWVRDHPAAAHGIVASLESGHVHRYDINHLLLAAGSQALAEAGAPADIIEWAQACERPRDPLPREPDDHPPPERQPEPLPLPGVLDLPADERFATLLRQSTRLARDAQRASPATRERLHAILDETWAGRDLRDGITLTATGASVQHWADLVLTYGPASAMTLEDARWRQAATCGWLFSEQLRWLGQQATQERLDQAAAETRPTARHLAQLVSMAGDHDVDTVVARTRQLEGDPLDDEHDRLLDALVRVGRPDAVRALRDRYPQISDRAAKLLARAGDLDAQRHELERLRDRFNVGERIDRDEVPWLEQVQDPSLLDVVLEVIYAAHVGRDREGDEGPFTAARAAISVLDRIGGPAALDALDDIVIQRPWPGAQWLTQMRAEVLQRELTMVSAPAAAAKLSDLGLG